MKNQQYNVDQVEAARDLQAVTITCLCVGKIPGERHESTSAPS
jgi:hypothetical protein